VSNPALFAGPFRVIVLPTGTGAGRTAPKVRFTTRVPGRFDLLDLVRPESLGGPDRFTRRPELRPSSMSRRGLQISHRRGD